MKPIHCWQSLGLQRVWTPIVYIFEFGLVSYQVFLQLWVKLYVTLTKHISIPNSQKLVTLKPPSKKLSNLSTNISHWKDQAVPNCPPISTPLLISGQVFEIEPPGVTCYTSFYWWNSKLFCLELAQWKKKWKVMRHITLEENLKIPTSDDLLDEIKRFSFMYAWAYLNHFDF